MERSQADHINGAAGERKAALELGAEAEELRGTKGGCAVAVCKGVSFVAAPQCWWVGRAEASPEPPP